MDNLEDKKMLIVLVENELYENLASIAKDRGISLVEFANQVLHSISVIDVVKRTILPEMEKINQVEVIDEVLSSLPEEYVNGTNVLVDDSFNDEIEEDDEEIETVDSLMDDIDCE